MSKAIEVLSPKAYYLYTVMCEMEGELNNRKILEATDYGVTAYYKYKRELKDKDYLQVTQVGKHIYEYILRGKE